MTKEPGIIRLAYEAIVAQICINANAQFTIQLSCGLIQDEELEDLQASDHLDMVDGYQRATRQTHLPNQNSEHLTRKHCNNIKQLG